MLKGWHYCGGDMSCRFILADMPTKVYETYNRRTGETHRVHVNAKGREGKEFEGQYSVEDRLAVHAYMRADQREFELWLDANPECREFAYSTI